EGNVMVYRIADGREILRLPSGGGPNLRLVFSPDGRYLSAVYAVRGHAHILWDLGGDGPPRKVMDQGKNIPYFSADCRRFAIRLSESAVGLYDPATGELWKRLTVAPQRSVREFHPDGRRLVLLDQSPRTLRLIDIEREEEVWSHSFEAEIEDVAWRGD